METGSLLPVRVAATIGILVLAVACSSSEDRALDHLSVGRAHLAEGRSVEAKLEFQSALRFDPQNVEANNELAVLELKAGNTPAALIHMQEAYDLDPTNSVAALNLASMLESHDTDQAEALIEGVIHRDPENALGYIGRSNLALVRGRTRAAVLAARKAMEVAPDDPRADFQLGYALQAMIREGQVTGEPVEDSVYQSALASLERYIKKGGDSPWNAQIEEARIMAAWEGNNPQAAMQFKIALENARQKGSVRDLQHGAARALTFARSVRNWELQEHALEILVESEPRDYSSWRELAETRARLRKDPQETWAELVAARPDDPKAHIEYARFLVSQWKLDEALAYLDKKAAEGIDPAVLKSAVASTQIAARRIEDAERTIQALEKEHRDHPRTILGRAQLDIRSGRMRKAVASLRATTELHADPDALLLLARAERALGNREAAQAALDRAIEAQPVFFIEAHRMRAELLTESGDWPAALQSLTALEERAGLMPKDQLLMARCRYELGHVERGRQLLKELIARRIESADAVLEYLRREGSDAEARKLAKRELDLLSRREPRNWEILVQLTRLDLEDGLGELALARLDRVVGLMKDETPAPIRLLRARTNADMGREENTLEDARAAFELQPRLRGALELLVALHLRKGELTEALAATEAAAHAGALSDERRLLLGRLYHMSGRDAEAVATLEQTLESDQGNPSVYFVMGMALQALDRDEEATKALEKALSISTTFPEADHARQALEGRRGAGAS